MDISKLKTIRKGLNVERLHTVPHIIPYSNGLHSANAALIAHQLCTDNNIDSANVIRYMLLHDVAEGYVGDTPAYVKKEFPAVKGALAAAEKDWERTFLPDIPKLEPNETWIAKASDLLELGFYALDELAMGNSNLKHVLATVVSYANDLFVDTNTEVTGVNQILNYFASEGKL